MNHIGAKKSLLKDGIIISKIALPKKLYYVATLILFLKQKKVLYKETTFRHNCRFFQLIGKDTFFKKILDLAYVVIFMAIVFT
jgi:hypothetical protein